MIGYFLGKWSVVGGAWSVVGGRCHCGRWAVVCGRWLVGGQWFCTTPQENHNNLMICLYKKHIMILF